MSVPEISRSHLVSMEDVGHETSPTATHNGFVRHSKVRTFKTKHDRTTRKTNTGQSSADGDATGEEDGSEEDEAGDKDDEETEVEEPEVLAPSGVAIDANSQPTTKNAINVDANALAPPHGADQRQAGLLSPFHTPSNRKKRTLSELSARSLVSTIEYDQDQGNYPRKKVDRRLSNGDNGLLKYDGFGDIDLGDGDDFAIEDYEEAIKSSDDEAEIDILDRAGDSQDSIEKLEEQIIIQEILSGDGDDETVRSDSDDDLYGYGGQAIFQGDDFIFNQNFENEDDYMGPGSIYSAIAKKERKQSDGSVRRVRFEDEVRVARSSSDSSSDTTDVDVFPDLLDQDALDAQLRLDIERDIDLETGDLSNSDGSGSCWDFGEDEASKSFFSWHDVHTESESEENESSDASLSGYDSDGDTTDDDLPPPETIRAPSALLHRRTPSTVKHSAPSTPASFPRSKRALRGPVLGSFTHDRRKVLCDTDPTTGKFRIRERVSIPMANPFQHNSTESSAGNSPQVPLQGLVYDSDQSDVTHLFTGPSDVMMSGVFGGVPGQRYQNGHFVVEANGPLLIGPPEAFYPFTSFNSDGTPDTDDEEVISTEDEFDDDVDIFTAFLDVREDDENDEEELDEDDSTSPTATDIADSTPTHARSISQAMIDHFDRGVVNSFRTNLDRHRMISRLPQDKSTVSAPLRTGKTAETVMTPSRKRKSSSTHEKTPRRLPVMGGFN